MEYEYSYRRAIAHLIDLIVVVLPIYFLFGKGENTDNLTTIISSISLLGYMVITEGMFGQSLGKKLLRIKVVMEDGGKCTFKAAVVRNLLRIIDALPSIYIVGILVITFTKKRQRVGDLAAKTVVVRV